MEVQPVSPKTIVKVNRVNIDKFVFIRYSLFKVKGENLRRLDSIPHKLGTSDTTYSGCFITEVPILISVFFRFIWRVHEVTRTNFQEKFHASKVKKPNSIAF
jgi:hypothetical protein